MNAASLAEIIIHIVITHYGFFESIGSNQGSLFILKIFFSLCYFLSIKQKIFTIFLL